MKLFYRKEGNGPAMIVIHGLYGSSDNWINMGKRLAENYTVYLIDLRNHGQSPFADDHTYDAMSDDLAQFFADHNISKATILGHSMGGKAAMWFAANYPEKTAKLIIADIAPINYQELGEKSQFNLHKTILESMKEIDPADASGRVEIEEKLFQRIGDRRISQFLMKNVVINRESKKFEWRLNIDALYNSLDDITNGVNYSWFEDRMPISNYPVIFIRGLKSDYVKDETIEVIKEIYPEASIIDIPDAGHWLHAEKPEEFMEAVLRCC